MIQKDFKQKSKPKKHLLLTAEESCELKFLIKKYKFKQKQLMKLIGTKHQSTVSILLNADCVKARFASLLEYLRLFDKFSSFINKND